MSVTAVIGGGVVGLAVARTLARVGREVVVLEAEAAVGTVTSARNSEVIHAGVYYAAGSLKASACVSGRRLLYRFCDEHGVPYKRCGKLIVATNESQNETLAMIAQRSRDNGLVDPDEALVLLTAAEARELEPELSCTGALLSPSTGVLDSHAYMLALQGDAEDAGAVVALSSFVVGAQVLNGGQVAIQTGGVDPMELECCAVVNCAGLGAPAIAQRLHSDQEGVPSAHYAKGNYYRLEGVRAPFKRLVYPVPEPDGAGLGVHITIDMGGQARFGPDVEWLPSDAPLDYTVDPKRSDAFYEAVRRYWPALPDGALAPDYAGIRPKLRPAGSPEPDEFRVLGPRDHGVANVVHLLGVESPGLTASLALAEIASRRLTELPV